MQPQRIELHDGPTGFYASYDDFLALLSGALGLPATRIDQAVHKVMDDYNAGARRLAPVLAPLLSEERPV